ncbi:MAG: tellurite resistance TerB family protein [Oscillatoriales cyanobacterium SM2_1_8]|nr:tellurite resistance TerB family protein [Oscillatoriales cyanobacterium SM2_1_8]
MKPFAITPDTPVIPLSTEEAIAAIGLVAAVCDYEGDTREAEAQAEVMLATEYFAGYSEDELMHMLDRLAGISEEKGVDTLYASAVAALQDETPREIAFTMAIAVIQANGQITSEEEELFHDLKEALQISDERADAILDSILESIALADDPAWLEEVATTSPGADEA